MPAREVGITEARRGRIVRYASAIGVLADLIHLSTIVTPGYLLIRNGVLFILYIFLNSPTCLQLFHNIIRQGI